MPHEVSRLVALQLFAGHVMHYLIYGVHSEVALARQAAAAMRKEVTVVEACRASRNEKINQILVHYFRSSLPVL